MPRRSDPDYVVDADRGPASLKAKHAQLLDPATAAERDLSRRGLAELDAMTEALPGLSRQRRDRERLTPRATPGQLGHPRMQRPLPTADDERVPFSSRQKKARSKTRVTVQGDLPDSQYQAQRRMTTDEATWHRLNDALSNAAGDPGDLTDIDQAHVRRVDKTIQAYEAASNRGHVVYANVAMPPPINHSNLQAFVRNNFREGDEIAFDRYTLTTHQMHETVRHHPDPAGRVAVFEITTRRGAYLGHSDTLDNTEHLLPRGMRFRVVDTHQATYRAPDGTINQRVVVQLVDITPEPASLGGTHERHPPPHHP